MSPFGENLRKIRIERGMSQEELAAFLGTSKQVISRYETAQRTPKVSTVAEYAEKLGVRIATLTGDPMDSIRAAYSPDSPVAQKLREIGEQLTPIQHPEPDPDRQELLDIYDRLNERGQADLLKYARYLNADPDMRKDDASNTTTA